MALRRHHILCLVCLAFILGVALGSFYPVRPEAYRLGLVFAGFVMAGLSVVLRPCRGWALFLLLAGFVLLGLGHYQPLPKLPAPGQPAYYNDRQVEVAGTVSQEVALGARSQKVTLQVRELSVKGRHRTVKGRLLVIADQYPRFAYGDDLRLSCRLHEPEPFNGFAYDRYLAKQDIYSVCYYPEITAHTAGRKQDAYSFLLGIKEELRRLLEKGMEEPAAGLARAMVLGDKQSIGQRERQVFAQAGISHIAAISGMHVSILAAMIMFLLLGVGLKRQQAFYLAVLFLAVYVCLIGFPASAVRASLMGFLVLWALQLGRLNRVGYSLLLAASLMLVANPRLLRDDIGFQLSFLAVFGIAWLYEPIYRLLKYLRLPRVLGVRSVLAVTLSAQALTVPLALYHFEVLSLVSPLTNVLVLWVLPFFLGAALVGFALGGLFPSLALIWFLPAWFILEYVRLTAQLLVKLPGASLETGLDKTWLLVYYSGVLVVFAATRAPTGLVPGLPKQTRPVRSKGRVRRV